MSVEEHLCDKCGRLCKDKRGLSIHMRVCQGTKDFICNFCNTNFSSIYSLSIHSTRCTEVKKQKQDQDKVIKSEVQQLQDKLKELELKHQQEIKDLNQKIRSDYEQQLKMREEDIKKYYNEFQDLSTSVKLKDQKIEDLNEQVKELKVDKLGLQDLNAKLSLKDTSTTIINQNDNRVQLQSLEPSMIQGRINPPDYVIKDVQGLFNMLRSLGVRNSYRVNDKSRGTLTWNKPEEGDVKDPTGEQLMNHIIDILNDDLVKERSYYEEELKYQCEQEDPDMYLMGEAKTFITFCNQLIRKDPNILKKFKTELIKQGKSKKDTQEDQISETTYIKFTTAITLALFSNIYDWIEMSFYDIGRHIGSKIRDHYHLEGASREALYIVIHSDNNYNKQVRVKKLVPFISESVSPYFEDELIESLLSSLLLNNKYLNRENVEKNLQYLKNPTLEDTEEIMKGIVSV